ncbi:AzlD domain-containing protein [Cereibacter changlensis JA139]|jgi:branched-subunit amino acid transport protein|uniref:AzlD domain-containing protein n=2 Tax=Cereibacter changlensis TaxID=402884 RepID=A0A2T4JYT1_9RHOB|nr:AzlD domain-containing protein [Cereibacter changlensis]MBZ4690123.1 putative transrane protein [Cereibacter sp.]PTE23065.1 AzlD domain-containing protein [Cereibacter changlensis JA139]PZX50843.1 branched-subunit amino acid transport protein [Cereibacter changlensis]
MIDDTLQIWTVIIVLGLGTFLLRFSFLGMIGSRAMPGWALRLLRYTPVAVMPGLVAPLVLWPAATGGETDPARLAAALVTLAAGVLTRNVLAAIFLGAAALYLTPLLF